MKNIDNLINSLLQRPELKKAKNYRDIDKFKLSLPYTVRKNIAYIAIKGDRMLFAMSHPAFIQEFKYRLKDIESTLDMAKNALPSLREIKKLEAFIPSSEIEDYGVIKKPSFKSSGSIFGDIFENQEGKNISESEVDSDIRERIAYRERSNGEFKNLATNAKLRERFENIREIIFENLKREHEQDS